MRGDLSETSVADLCRGLSAAGATGAVDVTGDPGDARIFFRAGNVYWAASPAPRARLGDRLVNAGLLSQEQLDRTLDEQRTSTERTKLGALLVERGLASRDAVRVFVQEQILDALFDMVQWRRGEYVFNPGEVVDEKLPIDMPVDQILVEVARRQSEWDQIQAAIPDLDMVPDFVRGGSSAHAALEPDEFAVLANVDGERSIRDLADHLGYSEFEAARIVYGLTLLGIVDVAGPDEEEDVPADDDTDLDVDVASALEEAIATDAPSASPAVERPRVKLHVDDDVRGYVEGHEPTAADVRSERPTEEGPERRRTPPAEPAVAGTERSVEDLAAALAAALDEDDTEVQPEPVAGPEPEPMVEPEPEPEPEPEAEPAAAFPDPEEPEPWVAADDVPAPTPTTDVGFFAGSTAPPSARGQDLADDEFDALLDELASPPDTSEAPAPAGGPPPEDAPAAEPPAEPPAEVEEEPVPAETPPERSERPSGAGGDVSEFLRELSQLAVDEPPAGANPGPTRPRPAGAGTDAPDDDAPPAAPSREDDRRQAAEKRDDRNKKRGLFGWNR